MTSKNDLTFSVPPYFHLSNECLSLVVWIIEIIYGKALDKCKLLALSFLCLLTASIESLGYQNSLRTSLGRQSAHLPFIYSGLCEETDTWTKTTLSLIASLS